MKYYKVKADVATRAGVASARYRTADGMMILNEQDVRMIRLEPEEYLTGIAEAVLTEAEAAVLIEQGGRQMGIAPVTEDVVVEVETPATDVEETTDVEQAEEEVTNE